MNMRKILLDFHNTEDSSLSAKRDKFLFLKSQLPENVVDRIIFGERPELSPSSLPSYNQFTSPDYLKEVYSEQNFFDATKLASEYARDNKPITINRMHELNRILVRDINTKHNKLKFQYNRFPTIFPWKGGRFRLAVNPYANVRLSYDEPRRKTLYPSFLRVRHLMKKLEKYIKKTQGTTNTIKRASRIHEIFVSIHPYPDSNGRTSRLLMNYALMQGGYPPIEIPRSNELQEPYSYSLILYQRRIGKEKRSNKRKPFLAKTGKTPCIDRLFKESAVEFEDYIASLVNEKLDNCISRFQKEIESKLKSF